MLQWIQLGNLSLPAVLTQVGPLFVATSPDWRLAEAGPTPCDALQALSRLLDERLREALELSRQGAS